MTGRRIVSIWPFGSVALILAVGLFLLACLHAPASAHAVLLSSTPAQGEALAVSPAQLALTFSGAVEHVAVTVVDRNGKSVGPVIRLEGREVVGELAEPLAAGVHALNWRAQSEDGHPVSGAVVFSIGAAAIPDDFKPPASETVPIWLTWGAKALFYVGCFLGVGGSFYAAWIARRTAGPSTLVFLLSGLISGAGLIFLWGCETLGAGSVSLLDAASWQAGLRSSLGRCNTLAFLAIGLALLARWQGSNARIMTGASLLLLGPAFALTGHASGAGVPWLSFLAISVHVAAVCFWAGALPGLWRDLAPVNLRGTRALLRFSAAIPFAVGVMLAAGLYLAFVQLGSPEAVLTTGYGRVLVAKLILVAAALGLGTWNRIALTPRAGAGNEAAAASMRKVIVVEIVLILAVAATTALWRFTPPPRALDLASPAVVQVHIHDAAAMANLTFETRQDLRFDAEIILTNAEFDPLNAKELTLTLAATDERVAPFAVKLEHVAPGQGRAERAMAPCDCRWRIRLDALVSDFDLVTLEGDVKLLGGD